MKRAIGEGTDPRQLAARLQACFQDDGLDARQREELAEVLRAGADAMAAPQRVRMLSDRLAVAATRAERARVAAELLRHVMQARDALAAEPSEQEAQDARRPRDRRARAERSQARALAAAKRVQLPPDRQPVETLSGIGRVAGQALRARGIATVGDLAWLLPLDYHDEREVVPIAELREGERQVTEGEVARVRVGGGRGGRRSAHVVLRPVGLSAGQGAELRLAWFRVPAGFATRFREGARYRVAGRVEMYRGVPSITHPETERIDADGPARTGIAPRYPSVAGVPPKLLARVAGAGFDRCRPSILDAVPAPLREREQLGSLVGALASLHRPEPNLGDAELAAWNAHRSPHHARLAFEEFFMLELALQERRQAEQGIASPPLRAEAAPLLRARAALGFELTAAQSRALAEVSADLAGDRPMRRLLQGDVGSGKTAVAMLAAAQAVAAGAQVAMMAPTEVLAEQHFRSVEPVARALGLRAALVLGGARASHRRKTREALARGELDLAVGTHALLSEGVVFHRLGLVVVDEQHRFGVGQRLRLVDKGEAALAPHLLVMTATPIPRTLALALHGDLSASVIDELPPGRLSPVTRDYSLEQRTEALRQLERALDQGGQAYVVCPSIDPSEDMRCAVETHAELVERFAARGVALLHGRQKAEERADAMERFVRGETSVLVTTTVIEVGVDVPRANVILIENAERFGLAQLHQLRGRVGRGGQRSACLLVHQAASEESRARMRILCETNDGFRIAEEDLALRGPGELFGRRQSGLPGFRFGNLARDLPMLERARDIAREIMEADPALERPENACVRAALERLAEGDRAVVKEEAG